MKDLSDVRSIERKTFVRAWREYSPHVLRVWKDRNKVYIDVFQTPRRVYVCVTRYQDSQMTCLSFAGSWTIDSVLDYYSQYD